MIKQAINDTWREPPVSSPPVRVWRDWALLAVFLPGTALEMILREAAGWEPAALVGSLVLAGAMFWRRSYPLAAMTVAFASIIVLDTVSRIVADQPLEYVTAAVVLITPYALFRWGSGKHAIIGLALMVAQWGFFMATDWSGFSDAIGGFLVIMFPAALGDLVRYQDRNRKQTVQQTKMREREQLARELHDTVAHHVSAIAIQAQAGQAVAGMNPEAAVQALATIEQEASKTLIEMRTMVSALRAGEEAQLAPQAAFDDIERMAKNSPVLPISVERSGDLDGLSAPVDRALFRLAQESITNATRHARNATRVSVRLAGEGDQVTLSVDDDGDRQSFDPALSTGFGLVGMKERAALLGGTLDAGPSLGRGWRVVAVLPKIAVSS